VRAGGAFSTKIPAALLLEIEMGDRGAAPGTRVYVGNLKGEEKAQLEDMCVPR
jgi:hypothetical protein